MTDRTEGSDKDHELERYASGEILGHHGRVNRWLLAVYAILAVWGVYYLFRFWGGLGPGLAR